MGKNLIRFSYMRCQDRVKCIVIVSDINPRTKILIEFRCPNLNTWWSTLICFIAVNPNVS